MSAMVPCMVCHREASCCGPYYGPEDYACVYMCSVCCRHVGVGCVPIDALRDRLRAVLRRYVGQPKTQGMRQRLTDEVTSIVEAWMLEALGAPDNDPELHASDPPKKPNGLGKGKAR
jgi:hypothetical protein